MSSRFLILPEHHHPSLASRVLALCERRLARDWRACFGYPLLLLETFVDPRQFHGTIYRAANGQYAGDTRGFRRTRTGYRQQPASAKRVFVRPLHRQAQARLSRPVLDPQYRHGAPKIMIGAEHMRIRLLFADRGAPDFREPLTLAHGRLEQRAIWTSTRLNGYLKFPSVGQVFCIERPVIEKKTGKASTIQRLARNVRLVFDYLRMTANSRPRLLPAREMSG